MSARVAEANVREPFCTATPRRPPRPAGPAGGAAAPVPSDGNHDRRRSAFRVRRDGDRGRPACRVDVPGLEPGPDPGAFGAVPRLRVAGRSLLSAPGRPG